jgi:hypothetical protein
MGESLRDFLQVIDNVVGAAGIEPATLSLEG